LQLSLDTDPILKQIRELYRRVKSNDAGWADYIGVGISRVRNDVLKKTAAIVADQIENGTWTSSIVK